VHGTHNEDDFRGKLLESFVNITSEHGNTRLVSATEYSLGLGLCLVESMDTVWMIVGSRVPVVLRLVEGR
jgi:hypothetical protein